ncbi:hypothetical protein F4678DRAFT_455065 [Xylaria arbuscula]|nr:hypothetical protein F4678DRAFT_455065 [Xylaria arbuscula]
MSAARGDASALATMDRFSNRCHPGGIGTMKGDASRRLADIVATGWRSDNKATEDVARARHQVAFLKASMDLNLAELFVLEHSCAVCNNALPKVEGAHPTCPRALSTHLWQGQMEKMHKMQKIGKKIASTDSLMKDLEGRLKTYEKIEKSLEGVTTAPGVDYRYNITASDGVSLVINEKNCTGGQPSTARSKFPNIVDTEVLPPIATPVLAPATPPIVPPATPVLAPVHTRSNAVYYVPPGNPRKTQEPRREEAKPIPTPKPEAPALRIWDTSPAQACLRQINGPRSANRDGGTPPFFKYGIQYQPAVPPDSIPWWSRMIVFSGLHPLTTWSDVLARVRGGPILRVERGGPTTMTVSFVHPAAAHAYARRVQTLNLHGQTVKVKLVPTASYPVRTALMEDIALRGVTRCLALPGCDDGFARSLELCLARRQIRDFVVSTIPTTPSAPIPIPTTTTAANITPAADADIINDTAKAATTISSSLSAASNTPRPRTAPSSENFRIAAFFTPPIPVLGCSKSR